MRDLTLGLAGSLLLVSACAGADSLAPRGGEPATSFDITRAAARPFLPGEQQPLVDLTLGPLAIYPVGAGQNLLQTFTPPVDQKLGYLQLPVRCDPGVLLNVRIFKGKARTLLYEVNVLGLPAVLDGTFQLIQVYDPTIGPIRLNGGTRYSFELAAFPGPGATGITCSVARGPATDTYAGGRGFYSGGISGWIRLPGGEDLSFITLVR